MIRATAEIGETVSTEATPRDFGRIAAQTAKQVILQRIREAERDVLYNTYIEREGELITGTVQSIDHQAITLNLGKTEAVLPRSEQIPGERPHQNQRIKAYVVEVEQDQPRSADHRVAHAPEHAAPAAGDGSAGDLQRHGRDQADRPRGRLALQGGGGGSAGRRGSGGLLRGHARRAHPEHRQRAERREDRRRRVEPGRRHVHRQCAEPGQGDERLACAKRRMAARPRR